MTGAHWTGEIVGHRGAAGLAPENTVESFEAAIAAGADRVELDVRRTEDHRAIVFHDSTLERFLLPDTDGDPARPVSRHTLAQLAKVDVGRRLGRPGCFIPLLDDVLDRLRGRVGVNVECKGGGSDGLLTLDACLRALAAHGDRDETILSSFHPEILQQALGMAPGIPRALLVTARLTEDFVRGATALGCVALHAEAPLVSEHLVARCRHAGLEVRAWTVNDADEMGRLMDLGVDGIITDHPERLRALAGR